MTKSLCLSKEYILGTSSHMILEREMPEDFTVNQILMNPLITIDQNYCHITTSGWMIQYIKLGELIVKTDDGQLEESCNYSPLSNSPIKIEHNLKQGEKVSIGILYNGVVPANYWAGMTKTFSVTL